MDVVSKLAKIEIGFLYMCHRVLFWLYSIDCQVPSLKGLRRKQCRLSRASRSRSERSGWLYSTEGHFLFIITDLCLMPLSFRVFFVCGDGHMAAWAVLWHNCLNTQLSLYGVVCYRPCCGNVCAYWSQIP